MTLLMTPLTTHTCLLGAYISSELFVLFGNNSGYGLNELVCFANRKIAMRENK